MLNNLTTQVGDKVTIYSVNDGAMTICEEIIITEVFDEPQFRPSFVGAQPSFRGRWRYGIAKLRGKRKQFYLEFCPHTTLVIPGWDHPKRDSDVYNRFQINACINIAATTEEIKQLVEKNINPDFAAYDILLSAPESGEYVMVYPDSDTEHAVIERLRKQ